MLQLSTFCTLLALAVAQGGYEYNKPGSPFGQGTTPNRPGITPDTFGGYPGGPTTPAFPGPPPQGDEYLNTGSGSTPDFPGPSNYPTGPNQGYPGSVGQRPQGYPGQGPTSFPQGPKEPSNSYPGQTDQGQIYPGQSGQIGNAPGITEFGSAGQIQSSDNTGAYEGGDYSAIPGEPDKDYPILTEIPQTSFRCDAQAYPGYYADVETRCQVFHVCANNRTFDFLCPNGTIFSQQVFVCVWWNQFDCNSAPGLYEQNDNLYDYSKTGTNTQSALPITGPNDYPQGPEGSYPGSTGLQGPSVNYPGSTGPQGPSDGYPGSQGPLPVYPGNQGPQGSFTGYPGSQGPEGPSSGFPDNQTPQGQSVGLPGRQGPQGSTTSGYPGNQRPHSPSAGYPSPGAQPPSYPGSTGPSSYPGPGYAGSPGAQSPTSYPGSNYQNQPGSSKGYPSGKPAGPSFPLGGRPQSDTGIPAQQPNREYLPPRT